jgi:5-methylcytosine-specific restriction endonuclease McrA
MPRPHLPWQDNRVLTPGEKLYRWLHDRYPITEKSSDWMQNLASDFNTEELEKLLHQSTLLMMMRRLLANAEWYRRRYTELGIDAYEEKFEQDFLRHHLSFSPRDARLLSNLVYKSLEASRQEIPNSLASRIRDRSNQKSLCCGLCGKEIDYAPTPGNDDDRFSLDHIWPRSLGGNSEEYNLRVTCGACNSLRQSYVSAADTHYEHHHVKLLESDRSFLIEATRLFRLAVNFQSNFTCKRCERPVAQLPDGLRLEARSRHETHNIFNSISICTECKQ